MHVWEVLTTRYLVLGRCIVGTIFGAKRERERERERGRRTDRPTDGQILELHREVRVVRIDRVVRQDQPKVPQMIS